MPRRLIGYAALSAVVAWLVSVVAVMTWGARDMAGPADAIVVLGAAQYAGRPSPVLKARLDHAVSLWKKGLAPRLLLTGGRGTVGPGVPGCTVPGFVGMPGCGMVGEAGP